MCIPTVLLQIKVIHGTCYIGYFQDLSLGSLNAPETGWKVKAYKLGLLMTSVACRHVKWSDGKASHKGSYRLVR